MQTVGALPTGGLTGPRWGLETWVALGDTVALGDLGGACDQGGGSEPGSWAWGFGFSPGKRGDWGVAFNPGNRGQPFGRGRFPLLNLWR